MLPHLTLIIVAALGQSQAPKDLVNPDIHPTQIAFGFRFAGGPVWTRDGRLLWSDLADDTVYELRNGKAVPVIKPSHFAAGHAIDLQGRLVSCLRGSREVIRKDKLGKIQMLASTWENQYLNGPADLAVKSDGAIYFSDPITDTDSPVKGLGFSGVYRISVEGKLSLLTKDFALPNGLAFSPDESQLYISDTVRHCIRVFHVAPDSTLADGRVFAYLTGELAGAAAGLKVDVHGNVYTAGPGGVQVFDHAGKYLGLIYIKDIVTNFCFGDRDFKTLYITAAHAVYKIRVKVAGIGPSGNR